MAILFEARSERYDNSICGSALLGLVRAPHDLARHAGLFYAPALKRWQLCWTTRWQTSSRAGRLQVHEFEVAFSVRHSEPQLDAVDPGMHFLVADFEEVVTSEDSPAVVRDADCRTTVEQSCVSDAAPVQQPGHDPRIVRKPVRSIREVDA
jgi:hypothetical protein